MLIILPAGSDQTGDYLLGGGGEWNKKNRTKKSCIACTKPVMSGGSEGDESAVQRQVE